MNDPMRSPKVVLVTGRDYVTELDRPFLLGLLKAKVELFCAVGRDATAWEDAMDWLCIEEVEEAGSAKHVVVTTAHMDQTVEEVIAFAEHFECSKLCHVEVLYL